MKLTAVLFAAGVAAASAGANPAPHGFPAPMPPPAPGADHHAPSPDYSYENPFYYSTTTTGASDGGKLDLSDACTLAFNNLCGSTTAKNCATCVSDNAMTFVSRSCDTLQMIQKLCPTTRRNLRLAALPSPYPSPAPADPPAPADGHIRQAPAPTYYYEGVQWAPSPLPGSDETPANVKACSDNLAGVKCSYTLADKTTVSGTCVLNGAVLECTPSTDKPVASDKSCDDTFTATCGGVVGTKQCSQCVFDNRDTLIAADCGDVMKLISGSC